MSEHLTKWEKKSHRDDPSGTGCLGKHQTYKDKQFPNCNYRKNAHDYSKGSETNIYDVPNARANTTWCKKSLGTGISADKTKAGKTIKGSKPAALFDASGQPTHAWDLATGENFTHDKKPYWHNTHHVIAAGEVNGKFGVAERKLIVASGWNINMMPNVIILPKQPRVAHVLKLPAHVPPNGAANHRNYSIEVGKGLNSIKVSMAAQGAGHSVTDANKDKFKDRFDKASKKVRDFLIKEGMQAPGVNLDSLALDSINW